MIIGLDNGNSCTKTASTSTASGYTKHTNLPFGVDKYLKYYGEYYVPAEPFPYTQDKTQDQKMLHLSIFAIADEIITRLRANGVNSEQELIEKINSIKEITLGVGLPPAHFALKEKIIHYFKTYMGNGINYEFCGYKFSYRLKELFILPQDYAAIVTDRDNSISTNYEEFLGIDIGGYTADVVNVEQKKPKGIFKSLPLGVLCFYRTAVDVVLNETGIQLKAGDIESVMRNRKNAIPADCTKIIHEQAGLWVEKIVNGLSEAGYELRTTPCLFLGGGALLFAPYISKNTMLRTYDIIQNPCANAIGYEKLIRMQLKARQQ